MIPPVGVALRVLADPTARIFQASPLDGGVLSSIVQGLVLRGICDREYVAKRVVCAVNLVEACHGPWAPYVDNGIARAGEKERAVIGQEQAHDAALVCLDSIILLEGPQGPDHNLSILCAGVDAVSANGEGEHRALVLEDVVQIGCRMWRGSYYGRRRAVGCCGGHTFYIACRLIGAHTHG